MKEMLALQKEYEANEALKVYNNAMALFKAEDITVVKDKKVSYETDRGGLTEYKHASLANIIETVAPKLSEFGFSHKWITEQLDGGAIKVTCSITHSAGHSESTSLQSSRDDSGGKNNIQGLGSAISYLERYTFLALTGIATRDMDDDGTTAEPVLLIDLDQETVLNDLIEETSADLSTFLAYCKVDTVANLPAIQYDKAKRTLESKRA